MVGSQFFNRSSGLKDFFSTTGINKNFSVRESKHFHLWHNAKMIVYYRIYETTVTCKCYYKESKKEKKNERNAKDNLIQPHIPELSRYF